MRIWKTTLIIGQQTIYVPMGAQFLDVQVQNNEPQMWFLCDEAAPPESRHITIYGTGNPLPPRPGRYIATFQMYVGHLVFHVFELE